MTGLFLCPSTCASDPRSKWLPPPPRGISLQENSTKIIIKVDFSAK